LKGTRASGKQEKGRKEGKALPIYIKGREKRNVRKYIAEPAARRGE